MAANTTPIFTLSPRILQGTASAANANRDGTGTIVDLGAGGTNGTRITKINIKAIVTTTAGTIRFYWKVGATYTLWKEVANSAITVGANTPAWETTLEFFGERAIVIPSTVTLAVSTEKAEAHNIYVECADY